MGEGRDFLEEEPEGERLASEEVVEAVRPTPRPPGVPPPAARFAWTIRAKRGKG